MFADCKYTLGSTVGTVICRMGDFIFAQTQIAYFSYCGYNYLTKSYIIYRRNFAAQARWDRFIDRRTLRLDRQAD